MKDDASNERKGYVAYKITFDSINGIIQVHVKGPFDWNLIDQMAPAIAKKSLETGSRLVLIDFRKSHMSMATMKIYRTPAKLVDDFKMMGVDFLTICRAWLIPAEDKDFRFFVDVSENQGQPVKVFTNEEDAMNWLLENKR
jgi:hypothetical protein